MNSKAVFGTLLAMLLVGMVTVAFSIQLARASDGFVVIISPEHPTTRDEVNVTTILLNIPSISIGIEFGPLVRVGNEFSVDINETVPLIQLDVYVGNVSHTYELMRLSEGSYNFTVTLHVWQEMPMGTWVEHESLYRESFVVLMPQTPPPVGGITVPTNKVQRLTPLTSLAVTVAIAASFVGIRRIKKRQD